jgi:prophage regulatory protein
MAMIILRMKAAMAKTGFARSTIYALMKKGQFPHQVKLSEKAVGWLESDLDAFIQSRVDATIAQREA